VDRDFTAAGPNQLWVANITFVPTANGFMYLAVVLDAWSRKIVGGSMANHLRTSPHATKLVELGIRIKTVIRAQTGRDAAVIGALSVDGASGHWVNDQETVMRAVTTVIAALGVLGVVTASGPNGCRGSV
jgi:transposase InsO family protein